jgi:hypothetical protein
MMASSIPTEKLAKLIPLLSSDKDGEVIATVQAIRRTLAGAGNDLHDLAAFLEQPAAGLSPYEGLYHSMLAVSREQQRQIADLQKQLRNARASRSKATPEKLSGHDRSEARTWLDALAAAEPGWLSDWERTFVASMRAQLYTSPHCTLTPRQVAVINRLIAVAKAQGIDPAKAGKKRRAAG